MIEPECPKCEKIIIVIKWHKGTDDCKKKSVNIIKGEHIHYYCKCGYDFVRKI